MKKRSNEVEAFGLMLIMERPMEEIQETMMEAKDLPGFMGITREGREWILIFESALLRNRAYGLLNDGAKTEQDFKVALIMQSMYIDKKCIKKKN